MVFSGYLSLHAAPHSPCVCTKPRPALLLQLQLLPQPVDLPLLCQHLKIEVLHLALQARPLQLPLLQQCGSHLIVPAVLLLNSSLAVPRPTGATSDWSVHTLSCVLPHGCRMSQTFDPYSQGFCLVQWQPDAHSFSSLHTRVLFCTPALSVFCTPAAPATLRGALQPYLQQLYPVLQHSSVLECCFCPGSLLSLDFQLLLQPLQSGLVCVVGLTSSLHTQRDTGVATAAGDIVLRLVGSFGLGGNQHQHPLLQL